MSNEILCFGKHEKELRYGVWPGIRRGSEAEPNTKANSILLLVIGILVALPVSINQANDCNNFS